MIVAEAVAVSRPDAPYKFLDFFSESDSAFFAGRDEETRELVARISSERTLVLYGRSGLGKTSLLLAGVFPKLRERHFLPVHVRVLDEPLLALRNAVASAVGRPPAENAADLTELLAAVTAPAGTVVVFDQFEEYFIRQRQRPAAQRAFVSALSTILSIPAATVRVVFSLREDYLAEMDDLQEAFPDILASTFRLRPLTAFGARKAITTPLVRLGIRYEQRLVLRLVDVLSEASFDPVLLQIACTALYEEAAARGPDVHLTEGDLDAIGGLDGIFNRYLKTAIAKVPQGQMLLSRTILDALITLEDTKRAVTFEELGSNQEFVASAEEIRTVLDCLIEQRLVRSEMRSDKVWFELSHERLVKSILAWFRHDPEFSGFRSARDVIANATRDDAFRGNPELLLAPGQVTSLIWPYRMRLRLSSLEREFMFRSAVYRRLEGIEYWAEGLGEERCRGILLGMLRDEHVDARAGAAAAAGACGGSPALAEACLTAALEDTDEQVRRCAGASLAKMCGPAETARIAEALSSRETRRRARDLLADCVEAQAPISAFPWHWRIRAKRTARKRALKRHRDTIRERTIRGIFVGLLTALAWAAICGTIAFVGVSWVRGELSWFLQAVMTASVIGAAALAIGGWFGGALGRAAAKRAAIRGQERGWVRLVARLALHWCVFSVLVLVAALFDTTGGGIGLAVLGMLALVAFGLLWLLASAAYARLMRPATLCASRSGECALWGFLVALGPPLLLAVLWVAAMAPLAPQVGTQTVANEAGYVGFYIALPVSFLAMLLTNVLSDPGVTRIGPPATVSPRRRRAARWVLVVSTAAVAPAFLLVFGVDSVPWFAAAHELPAANPIQIRLRPNQPDSVYFKLRPASGSESWYVVGRESDVMIRAERGSSLGSGSTLLSVPGNGLLLAATSFPRLPAGPAEDVRFEPLPRLRDGEDLRLAATGWTPVILTLKASTDGGKRLWRTVWRGRVMTGTQPGGPGSLRVSLPRPPDSGSSDTIRLVPDHAPDTTASPNVEYRIARAGTALSFSPQLRDGADWELAPVIVAPDAAAQLSLAFEEGSSSPRLPGAGRVSGGTLDDTIDVPVLIAFEGLEASRYQALAKLSRLRDAVAREPRNPEHLNNLAWELYVTRDSIGTPAIETLAYARNAAAAAPNAAYVQDTLAHAALLAGDASEAAQAWERVIALQADFYREDVDVNCAKDLELYKDAAQKAGRPINPATIAGLSRRPTGR